MNGRFISTLIVVALTCVALGLAACGGDDESGSSGGDTAAGGAATSAGAAAECPDDSEPVSVRGAILPTATHLPMMVAQDEGIFEAHGVDMELTVVQNIATLPGAMGRQFDFGSTTLPDVIKAQQQGIDVVITANSANESSPDHEISGVFAGKDSGIESAADLVGKTVGVIAIGGNIHTSTLAWLIDEGVDHEKVRFIEVPPPNQLDQLNSGDIDAAENLEPFKTAMLEAGHTQIVDPITHISDPASLLSWMSAKDWAEENPCIVEDVVAAMEEAAGFIEENREQAGAVLAKYSGLPEEVAQSVTLPEYTTQIPDEEVGAWAEMLQKIGELRGDPADVNADDVLAIPEQ